MTTNTGIGRAQPKSYNGGADKEAVAVKDIVARLPLLTAAHICAMSGLVEAIYQAHSAAANGQLEQRKEIARELQEVVKSLLPEVEVKLHGSSVSRFALTSSNVNIFVDFPAITEKRDDIPKVLQQVLGLLKSNSYLYSNVREDFGRLPRITFTHKISGLECEIRIMDRLPLVIADLLATYAGIDERVLKLGVAFRYWAKICRLDMYEEGHHPAFMFLLMVVHFLQQRKPPILPVLHKPRGPGSQRYKTIEERQPFEDMYVTDPSLLSPKWEGSTNTESLGELWYELFRYYGKDFSTTKHVVTVTQIVPALKKDRKWLPPGLPRDKLVIEDPFLSERNICRGAGVKEVDTYFTSCLQTSLAFFATISLEQTNPAIPLEQTNPAVSLEQTNPAIPLEQTNPAVSLEQTNPAISLEQTNPAIPLEQTNPAVSLEQTNPAISLEQTNPAISLEQTNPAVSLEQTNPAISLEQTNPAIPLEQINPAIPLEQTNPAISLEQTNPAIPLEQTNPAIPLEQTNPAIPLEQTNPAIPLEQINLEDMCVPNGHHQPASQDGGGEEGSSMHHPSPPPDGDDGEEGIPHYQSPPCDEDGEEVPLDTLTDWPLDDEMVKLSIREGSGAQTGDGSKLVSHVGRDGQVRGSWADDYFKMGNFTYVRYPIVCSGCRNNGHSLKKCPEELSLPHTFPYPRDVPREKHKAVAVIKSAFTSFFDSVASDDVDVRKRRRICEDILQDIRPLYPDAELNMFGSSVNGFGNRSSDLDLCLKFEGHDETKKGDVVERIAELMKNKPDKYQFVVTVTDTRVPIVRFDLIPWAMNCDISLENNLALRNTKLLWTYCSLDQRVRVLGYALKQFAKVCDMADAPSGSLSSYAYILMLLHYLQRTKPPVVPVLQELHSPGASRQSVMLDGWDCYFFEVDDQKKLEAVWADYGKNRDSISRLWFGLLRYYAYEFDWIHDVVTIKQSKALTKFEKWWLSKPMCIEDPFDLDHNLGTPVTVQMRRYILQRFENGLRYHFSDALVNRIDSYQAEGPICMDFVMDPSRLIGRDKAPKIMLCNTCGLRGHKSADCPDRTDKKGKERKDGGPAVPRPGGGSSAAVQHVAMGVQQPQVHVPNIPGDPRKERNISKQEGRERGAPRQGRGVPDYGPPAPQQGPRQGPQQGRDVPDYGPPAPRQGRGVPDYGPPAPRQGRGVPDYGPPAPRQGRDVPDYGPPAPRQGRGVPDYGPPAPRQGRDVSGYGPPAPQQGPRQGPQQGRDVPDYGTPVPRQGRGVPDYGPPAQGRGVPDYGPPAPRQGRDVSDYGPPAPRQGRDVPDYGTPAPRQGPRQGRDVPDYGRPVVPVQGRDMLSTAQGPNIVHVQPQSPRVLETSHSALLPSPAHPPYDNLVHVVSQGYPAQGGHATSYPLQQEMPARAPLLQYPTGYPPSPVPRSAVLTRAPNPHAPFVPPGWHGNEARSSGDAGSAGLLGATPDVLGVAYYGRPEVSPAAGVSRSGVVQPDGRVDSPRNKPAGAHSRRRKGNGMQQ